MQGAHRQRVSMATDQPSDPAVEPVIAAPATALPEGLLYGDETVILLIKPSPLYILLGCMGTLALVAAIALLSVWVNEAASRPLFDQQALSGLCLLLAAIRLGWQFFEWMSHTYVLTDRRVIRLMGVLRVQMFQAELRRLAEPRVFWTVRERLFGLGTIAFSTHGGSIPEAFWLMVSNPAKVNEIVLQAIKRYGK